MKKTYAAVTYKNQWLVDNVRALNYQQQSIQSVLKALECN